MDKKIKKYILGIAIMTFLLVTSLYYSNRQSGDKTIEFIDNAKDRIEILNKREADNEPIEALEEEEISNFISDDKSLLKASQIEISKEVEASINDLMTKYYDVSKDFNSDIIVSTTQDEQEHKIRLFQKKKEIIESYENLKNYIKPGLNENTYNIFTTYDIKISNIETVVPGMSVLTVIVDEGGKSLIKSTTNDNNLKEYIQLQAEEEDLKAVIEDVNKRLSDAIEKNESLKKFVEYLKEIS